MAEMLGISKPNAYKIIRQMNDELVAKGYLAIPGKVAKKYFEEKFYGVITA
jgi:DNA-binding Lrp family transcriptional regulator